MKRMLPLTLALVAAALAVGCVTPTPQQLQSAQADRADAQKLLDGFAACIHQQDAAGLRALVAPSLAPSQFMPLALKLEGASWLKSYEGYTMSAGRALDNVSWRDWDMGLVQVNVPVTNANGDTFTNRFTLARGSKGWYIRDFSVDQPDPGDLIDPPPAVAQQIQPVVKQLMSALRDGRIAEIWYDLPQDPSARLRAPVVGFWERLSATDVPQAFSIMDDLNIVKKLRIAAWPDTSAPLELTWLGPGAVAAVYELPYAWAASQGSQTLRVELIFVRHETGWAFFTIRFHGAAIPYSE